MGRYYCNGKKGYCDRFVGNIQNAENIDYKDCEYADGSGGEYKDIVTNYDRIKSMSVEEMAEMMIEVMETPLSGKLFYITPDGRLFSVREKMKDKAVEHTKRWLLQEVSENE